ncbi:class A beta-lactamase-related serine hydrolase [Hymenobacter oligotrophus]|uniref:Class A beta-lactamase-related serine hydrolase n=1 Tax=Hymenobacter oligotrophus TaxID=2319843 RepID=A0A3B7QUW7_9BACT|nr:serine hydrolase domain-containing protein [Hymenobacter oligotrophus]AYA36848.1 class A beta-lactamase-related serine hydrolase [Hymenobacter oligotrophus]
MKVFLTALLWLCTLAAAAQQAELTALLKKHNVPGLQVVFSRKGETTQYSLGVRQAGKAEALTANTLMQAASLSKVVLAYTTLRLHDRGVINLDKPLLGYYRYPRLSTQPRAAAVTARMVLTHTTGLPNWAENPLSPTWATSPLKLKYAPDSCWNYSGEGFVWLQKTLEHITGKSLQTLAQEEVFGPLRMKNSSFVWREAFARDASFGHDKSGKPTEVRKFAEPNAGFSLLSTAHDYSRFVQALLQGQGLKPTTAQLLTAAANPANRCGLGPTPTDPHIAWAYGLGLANTSAGPALWHWGDNGDFKAFFMAFPAQKTSLVFFTNSANGLVLTDELLRLFAGPGEYRAMQWLAEEK